MSMRQVQQSGLRIARKYIHDTRGSLSTIIGLSIIPLFLAAGVAIDSARVSREQVAFAGAVDSAALAVAASDRSDLSDVEDDAAAMAARIAELKAFAALYIGENYTPQFHDDTAIAVSLDITDTKVTLSASHDYPTTIMKISGVTELTLHALAEVTKKKVAKSPIEIALVMDTTGSMGSGGDYIGQARTAAKDLMAILYGDDTTSPFIKVSLVPFSGAVRLNTSGLDMSMIDTTGTATVSKLHFTNAAWHNYRAWDELANVNWNGCVESRLGNLGLDDTAPTAASPNTRFTPYFAPDEPTVSGWGYSNEYITNSGTPRETTGISTSTSYSNHSNRQRNVNKYVNKTISVESMTSNNDGPWANCAKSKIIPLTSDRATIESGLDAMFAAGPTVIVEGLAWGWRTLSPSAPFTQGAAYNDDAGWQKTIVLMTDGEHDVSEDANDLNGSTYTSYGYAEAALAGNRFGTVNETQANERLNTKLATLCNNIKNASSERPITIYTVAFRVTSSTVQNLLRNCATDPSKYMFAPDGEALSEHFELIANEIVEATMHLSK
ncbi:MAG: Tad domain-containing protein [Rhizobiales bacterium]|nr:Tad domain-containing protein [Hyphomicrobiales bacterium]